MQTVKVTDRLHKYCPIEKVRPYYSDIRVEFVHCQQGQKKLNIDLTNYRYYQEGQYANTKTKSAGNFKTER